MKVIVDFDLCEANGNCMDIAPEVFKLDDEDMLHILVEEPSAELHEKLRMAIQRCPRQCISVKE